jgi:putative ABC transport system permease protein
MSWLRRLSNTLCGGRHNRDLERELSFHIAERSDQLRSEGLSDDEAKRHARLQFGNPIVQRERTRDVDVAQWLDTFLCNVRAGVRSLVRTPGFTVTVVATLALGIGLNSAVFAALDAVLLRPLPFPQSERLVRVRQFQETETTIAPARLEDWNRLNSTFEALSGYYVEDVSDTTRDLPERLRRAVVAPRFLEVLSIGPPRGRRFTDAEHRFGGPPAVMISDGYWRNRLDADPNVLARLVRIADRSYSIVGVMPADFAFPDRSVDLWSPYPIDGPLLGDDGENRRLQWYTGIARMRPSTTLELARADLTAVQARLGRQYKDTDGEVGVRIVPLKDTVGVTIQRSLWLVFAAVSLLLFIACTNIAALLLSRTARRAHEIAIRFSLGASRIKIIGELLTETALLAFAGSAVGLAVAAVALGALRTFVTDLPRQGEIVIEPRMFIYTMASAVVVALLCGLLPAVRGVRAISSTPREGTARISPRHSVQWLLVAVQVSLSVTLLSGAALFVRSLEALSRVDPGFDAARILTFRLSGDWGENYDDPAGLVQRVDSTLEELVGLPGVEAAGTSWTLPGAPGPYQTEFELAEGRSDIKTPIVAGWRTVSPGYFTAMQIPLLAGGFCRSLPTGIHRPGSLLDLMVNRRFSDLYFSGLSPIGAQISWDAGALAGRIVGIVSDVRELGIDHDIVPTVYACDSAPNPFPWFVIRTSEDPATMAGAVRQRLSQLEPFQSVYDIAPLDRRIGAAYSQHRLRTWLLTLFAMTALALVCAGVYGTLNYAVSLRRREVALRLALGALRRSVINELMLTSVRIVGVAAACGLALALLFTQSLATMLYGVTPADPATLTGVIVVVVTVASIAALIPAARATFGHPMRALREE